MNPTITSFEINHLNTLTIWILLPNEDTPIDFAICPIEEEATAIRFVAENHYMKFNRFGVGIIYNAINGLSEKKFEGLIPRNISFSPSDWKQLSEYIGLTVGFHNTDIGFLVDNTGALSFFGEY